MEHPLALPPILPLILLFGSAIVWTLLEHRPFLAAAVAAAVFLAIVLVGLMSNVPHAAAALGLILTVLVACLAWRYLIKEGIEIDAGTREEPTLVAAARRLWRALLVWLVTTREKRRHLRKEAEARAESKRVERAHRFRTSLLLQREEVRRRARASRATRPSLPLVPRPVGSRHPNDPSRELGTGLGALLPLDPPRDTLGTESAPDGLPRGSDGTSWTVADGIWTASDTDDRVCGGDSGSSSDFGSFGD